MNVFSCGGMMRSNTEYVAKMDENKTICIQGKLDGIMCVESTSVSYERLSKAIGTIKVGQSKTFTSSKRLELHPR